MNCPGTAPSSRKQKSAQSKRSLTRGKVSRPIWNDYRGLQGSIRPPTTGTNPDVDHRFILSPEDCKPGYLLFLRHREHCGETLFKRTGLLDEQLGHPFLVIQIKGEEVACYSVSVRSALSFYSSSPGVRRHRETDSRVDHELRRKNNTGETFRMA